MNILILSPFNPLEFSEFLNEDSAKIPNINAGASAVHTVVREFLKDGHQVTVITYNMQKKPICDCCLRGKLLTIEILPQNTIFPKGMVLVRWYMVKRMIKYEKFPTLDDTADAIAMAVCHVRSNEVENE